MNISQKPTCSFKSGSALLVTLLVMSLLIVMVLTFVVVVRAEIRKVVQHQELMQARANARLGLEMAIAKLQETAGADTRVTAPAVSDPAARPNQFLLGRAIDSRPFIPGNSLQLNPRYGLSVGYFVSHDPNSAFDPRAFWPFQANGEVTSGNVLLVGPGSVAMTDSNSDGVPDGFVAAPLRPIQESVPRPEGQFAYWIRDDGMRAQINLVDPFRQETGRLDLRQQAATAQRVGSELLLPGFDPDSEPHNLFLGRTLTSSQLDLTPFVGDGGARELFHDITLQSLGLPVNVQTGGFRRDLTAVLREAEANGGQINRNGPQWQALLDFQEARLGTWRAQTVALESTSRPAEMPEHRWNALNAITLRADQAEPRSRASLNTTPERRITHPDFREKIFPPMSDLWRTADPGGASWKQLLTHMTAQQRLGDGNGNLFAGQVSEVENNLTPVIARISINYYFTLDWPRLRLHFVPALVLWNPYSEPIRVPQGQALNFMWSFQTNHWDGWGFSMRFSHPSWRGGDGVWSPVLSIPHQTAAYHTAMWFRLVNPSGSPDVVIPPGEATFFTLNAHRPLNMNVTSSRPGGNNHPRGEWFWENQHIYRVQHNVSNRIDLVQGLHDLGGYSFYIEIENFQDWILNQVARGPRRQREEWSGPDGFWNQWDRNGFPFAISDYVEPGDPSAEPPVPPRPVDGHRPPIGPATHGSDYPVQYAVNSVTGSLRNIAVNVSGLNPAAGWRIDHTTLRISGRGTGVGGSSLRNRGLYLWTAPVGATNAPDVQGQNLNAWAGVTFLHMTAPNVLHEARMDAVDFPNIPNLLPSFSGPPPSFDSSMPFDETYPGYPGWGTVWGLRMPDTAFGVQQTNIADVTADLQGENFAAPYRWLVDLNPAAPYVHGCPLTRNRAESVRGGGTINPPLFMGGFSFDPNHFNFAQLSHPGTGSMYIGFSDDLAPAGSNEPGWRPRMILYEIPRNSEDAVSIGSFMHARPHSIFHAWAHRIGQTHEPHHPRYFSMGRTQGGGSGFGTDYAPHSPAFPIGNSFAAMLVPRDRVTNTYFPGPRGPQNSPESIPFANGRYTISSDDYPFGVASVVFYPAYDTSYIYNAVLWDDFFFTPDSNRRMQWQTETPQRDFNTSAENVLLSGAFNVNSTSVSAWAAMLSSMLDVELPARDGSTEVNPDEERIPLSRFLSPYSAAMSPASGHDFEHARAYAGYRRLTQDEVFRLAEEIVEQVKLRGPFLSLSEFVNRRLVSAQEDNNGLGLSGALQAAITAAGLNEPMGTPSDDIWMQASDFRGAWRGAPEASAFHGVFLENVEGPRTKASAGYLMQSDLLARIGSVLQARSDTFTVRAYGALGQENNPNARVWLEAKVQRVSDFVDPANEPGDLPAELTALNQRFGRQFRVISFRYLGEEDI